MRHTAFYLLFATILLVCVAFLNKCTNNNIEQKCISNGGIYFKSIDAGHSLCQLTSKVK